MPACFNTGADGVCVACGRRTVMVLLVVFREGCDYLCWECWDWLCATESPR